MRKVSEHLLSQKKIGGENDGCKTWDEKIGHQVVVHVCVM